MDGAQIGSHKGGRRVLALSPKGGSGKTGLSRHMAVAAAMDGLRVATVDFDDQKSLTKWWNRREGFPVDFVNYDLSISQAEAAIQQIVDVDLLVIDTPPAAIDYAPEQTKALILAADLVLIPTRASIDDVESAIPLMDLVRSYRRPAAFVMNFIKPNVKWGKLKKELIAAGEICPAEIGDRYAICQAAETGHTILESLPGKRSADESVKRGAEEFLGVWAYAKRLLALEAADVAA